MKAPAHRIGGFFYGVPSRTISQSGFQPSFIILLCTVPSDREASFPQSAKNTTFILIFNMMKLLLRLTTGLSRVKFKFRI